MPISCIQSSAQALLLGLLLMLAQVAAASLDVNRERNWQGIATLELKLPEAPLEPGSVRVIAQGELLREGLDFRADALDGRVTLLNPRLLDRPLLIRYRVLHLSLPTSLALQRRENLPWVMPGAGGDSLAQDSLRLAGLPAREEENLSRLRYSGSFLRGVRVGSGGQVGMESGLRLQVEGQVGPDVEVEAFLSDRNTPIQAEGRSQNLEEIDRIHVQVRSPSWRVLLGDFDLNVDPGSYLRYRRTVDGLQAGYENGGRQLLAHLAVARGRFHRMEFAGQEGIQGPWQLRSEQGSQQILVLAGSERVWLDGLQLSRGEDRDYVMDYSLGQLLFTARRPISSESRIQVEYQYSERVYARSLYGMSGTAPLGGGLELSVGFAGERDDADRPLDLFLGEEDRRILAGAGDGLAGSSWGSGIRAVEPGSGFWRRVDSLAGRWGHFEWSEEIPPGQEQEYRWELRFSELGRDSQGRFLGDYSRRFSSSGRMHYRFEGEGGGAWAPLIPLPAPSSNELLDARLRWRRGGLEADLESALSRTDRNLLSSLDDADNEGAALRGSLRWHSTPWPRRRPLGRLEAVSAMQSEQADFQPFHVVDEVEFERIFGLSRAGQLRREDFSLGLRGADSLLLQLKTSRLSRETEISRLWEPTWRWRPTRGFFSEGTGRHRRREAPDSWSLLQELHLEQGLNLLQDRLTTALDAETRENGPDPAGTRHRQGLLRLEHRFKKPVEASLERQRRLSDQLSSADWSRLSQADQWRSRVRWTGAIQGEADWTHRRLDYQGLDSTDAVRDLAMLNLQRQQERSSWGLRYQVENSLAQERVTQYIRVDSLQGSYSRDPFNPDLFVPDPDGDYVAVPLETGRSTRAARIQAEASWRWEWGGFSGDHQILVDETSRLAHPAALYQLQPAAFLTDSTQHGRIQSRQDLELRETRRNGGAQRRWRIRWNEERSLDQPLVSAARRSWQRRVGLRVQDRLDAWRGALELERRRQESLMPGQTQERRLILAWRLESELSRELKPGWLLRGTVEGESARDEQSGLAGRRIRLEPALDGRLGAKGSMNARISWQQAWSDAELIPYELLGGARVGRTIRAGLEARLQLGRQTRLTLSWQLDALPERKAQQTGRVQVQSFF